MMKRDENIEMRKKRNEENKSQRKVKFVEQMVYIKIYIFCSLRKVYAYINTLLLLLIYGVRRASAAMTKYITNSVSSEGAKI